MSATLLQISRLGVSVPCSVPVVPGTPDTRASLRERTERCSVDAWWWIGSAATCDLHMRDVMAAVEDTYEAMLAQFLAEHPEHRGHIPNATESKPWHEQHRYAPVERTP